MADSKRPQRTAFGGVMLIAIGVLALISTIFRNDLVGYFFLPVLGLAFIFWGYAAHNTRILVPGGILTGIGAGVLLSQTTFKGSTTTEGAVLLIALGLGFLVIIPLSYFIERKREQWELIPGGILLALGVALLVPALRSVLTVLGQYWPVLLIVFGVYLLWRNAQRKSA